MTLTNEQTRSKYNAMLLSVETLRGGFGAYDDSVGSSYHDFYIDEYQLTNELGDCVNLETAACERVRNVNVDVLCSKASDLINRSKSYPMV